MPLYEHMVGTGNGIEWTALELDWFLQQRNYLKSTMVEGEIHMALAAVLTD